MPVILYISLIRNVVTRLSWPQFHISHLLMLADINVGVFLCHTVHGSESSFISTTKSCLMNPYAFPQVQTKHWNFLVATDPLLYFKSVFIDRVM